MAVRRFPILAPIGLVALCLSGCSSLHSARDRIVRAPVNCADQTVQVYFEPDSAEVTREGRAVIAEAARESRPCRVRSVEVLGLADATGAPDANLELSKRRAQSVSDALASAGLPAAEFSVAAAGQSGAVSADGSARPLRRRTDVVLHLAPR
jgi:outer membrane protein OmpA-like peptidoglycan-associated protein